MTDSSSTIERTGEPTATLSEIRGRAQKNFPHEAIQGATSALCLFGATSGGRTDLIHLHDAGLRDVAVVDAKPVKLAGMRAAFPAGWQFVDANCIETCREYLLAGRRFDVVLADGSAGTVDAVWEDLLPFAGALAANALLLRVDQRLLNDYDCPASEAGVADLARRLHGIEIEVRSLVLRSRSQGGTYWAVIQAADGKPFTAAWRQSPASTGKQSDSPEPYGWEHCVELHDQLSEHGCPDDEDCRIAINELRQRFFLKEQQSIYRAFTRDRFAMLPRRRVDEFENASACFDLDRFETINEALEAARVATSKRGRVNREINRATKMGYVVKPFDHRLHIPDIHVINTSKAARGGRPMDPDYQRSIEEMGGPPTQRYELQPPKCPTHFNVAYGVFMPEPGYKQGEIVTNERLVGYVYLYRYGNHCRYSRILGHAEHLPNGVMYLLHFGIVEEMLKLKSSGLRYIFYGAMFSRGRDGSLEMWKRRCLFEPKFMIYDEAGDWRGAAGMEMLPLHDYPEPIRDPAEQRGAQPRVVALTLPSGRRVTEEISSRPDLQARVMCSIDSPERRSRPYEYTSPRSRRRNFNAVLRLAELQRAAREVFDPALPRVLVTLDRLVAPDGRRAIALAPSLIRELSGRANIICFPKGLRNSRKVTQHLFDLLSSRPDIMILGMGLSDWTLDQHTGQTKIDLDETLYRFDLVMEVARRDFGARTLLVLDMPVANSDDEVDAAAAADAFVKPLRELAAKHGARTVDPRPAWAVDESSKHDAPLQAVLEAIRELMRGGTPDHAPDAGEVDGGRQYELAHRAEVTLSSGESESHIAIEGSRAASLHMALMSSTEIKGDDEGSSQHGKALQLLGGRDEFERARQKQIVDWLASNEGSERKRALLIGDSIRMRIADATGYGVHAYRRLLGRANLTHVPHNCGGTKVVLAFLDNWLSCRPDVVHINAGLHDLAVPLRGQESPAATTPAQYAQHLELIIKRIRAAGCETIIWGLNTPVEEQWHRIQPDSGKLRRITRYNRDVRTYNDVSIDVMRRLNVPVNDMFTPLWNEGVERVLISDGVHLNHRGSAMLGEIVAEAVLECL